MDGMKTPTILLTVRKSRLRGWAVLGTLGLLASLVACSDKEKKDVTAAGGGGGDTSGSGGDATDLGGAGGAAGNSGGGGIANFSPVACGVGDPSALPQRLTIPSPLISVGKRVLASAGVQKPEVLVDGKYTTSGAAIFGTPSETAPEWAAIEVGAGPSRVLLLWTDGGFGPYYTITTGAPRAYRILVSGDSTDGVDGTWTEVVSVTDNPIRAREHSFDFAGMSWVKLLVTRPNVPKVADAGASDASDIDADIDASSADAGAPYPVKLNEIAIHDISASGTERPQDTWFFLGDSITQGAFGRSFGSFLPFDGLINQAHPPFFPAMLNGGVGGEFARDGLRHVEQDGWLDLLPDMRFVAIGYGTNDSWGSKQLANVDFEAQMDALVQAVLAAGRVPILAQIPYSTKQHSTLGQFNQAIEGIRAKYALPCGPDLYTHFATNLQDLSEDGVHPNSTGYLHMNQQWAEAVGVLYPTN